MRGASPSGGQQRAAMLFDKEKKYLFVAKMLAARKSAKPQTTKRATEY